MFADEFKLKLGDVTVVGRRLTIKELRSNWGAVMDGRLEIETAVQLVRDHVRLENGDKFDPEDVSMDQMRQLIAQLTLPEEGRGISDFIGLLCP